MNRDFLDGLALLTMSGARATVTWQPQDIMALKPDWTRDQAADWLDDNAEYIADVMVARGFDAIADLLPEDEVLE